MHKHPYTPFTPDPLAWLPFALQYGLIAWLIVKVCI
jgi:hypothetical protein